MPNVASTGICTIIALIVNLKWYACKTLTPSLKLVLILAQCGYTKTAQRIFEYSDIQYTSLTLDKNWTFWYIERYSMSTYTELRTSTNSPVFWPTLYSQVFALHGSMRIEKVLKVADSSCFTILRGIARLKQILGKLMFWVCVTNAINRSKFDDDRLIE